MAWKNDTNIKEYILLGLSSVPYIQNMIFVFCLMMFLVILIANALIILATVMDSNLHTPMYFFLVNLSFVDICYTTSIVPRMLRDLLSAEKIISFEECVTQMYISLSVGMTACILLAIMAYDRYIAICFPLHYTTIISPTACVKIAAVAWICGFLLAILPVAFTWRMDRCGQNKINHFMCELPEVLSLGCEKLTVFESAIYVVGVLILFIPVSFIILSYIKIIRAILKISTVQGRKKTFLTCGSHIIVVILYYGSATACYMKPKAEISPEKDKQFAVFYSFVTPLVNPLIYTLRNKEVTSALKCCWVKLWKIDHRTIVHSLRS